MTRQLTDATGWSARVRAVLVARRRSQRWLASELTRQGHHITYQRLRTIITAGRPVSEARADAIAAVLEVPTFLLFETLNIQVVRQTKEAAK